MCTCPVLRPRRADALGLFARGKLGQIIGGEEQRLALNVHGLVGSADLDGGDVVHAELEHVGSDIEPDGGVVALEHGALEDRPAFQRDRISRCGLSRDQGEQKCNRRHSQCDGLQHGFGRV